jgi:hypothetical protein
MRFIASVLVVLGCAATGCGSTGSAAVETKSIKATIDVWVDAPSIDAQLGPSGLAVTNPVVTQVEATLTHPGHFENVALDPGDRLTFSSDQRASRPIQGEDGVHRFYTFDEHDWLDVTVALERTSHVSAPSSRVRVPNAISFTTPPPRTVSYATGQIDLSWGDAVGVASLTVSATDCINLPTSGNIASLNLSRADEGAIRVAASSLVSEAPPTKGTCVRVHLERAVTGTPDPALHPDTTINARRSQAFEILVVP